MLSRFRSAFVLALLITPAAFSQADKGTLLGTVLDSSGAPAPDTAVKVTEVNTNIIHDAKTNEAGNFSIPASGPRHLHGRSGALRLQAGESPRGASGR